MVGLRPLLARRHFLASTFAGSESFFLPVSASHGASGSPSSPEAETLGRAPAPQRSAASAIKPQGAIAGRAASFRPADDPAIRRLRYRARDEDLSDLKRPVRDTRWPWRENEPTQGVNLATIQKLADYRANKHHWRRKRHDVGSHFAAWEQTAASRRRPSRHIPSGLARLTLSAGGIPPIPRPAPYQGAPANPCKTLERKRDELRGTAHRPRRDIVDAY
jgi:hypothetical protein